MIHSIRRTRAVVFFLLTCACFAACAESLPTTAAEIDTLARRVAGDGGAVERNAAARGVDELAAPVVGTDYQKRTPEQILARWANRSVSASGAHR